MAKKNIPSKQVKRKVPLGEVLKLHLLHNHSLSAIGRQFGCSRQYISKLVKPFKDLIKDTETLDFYRRARANVLTAAEMKILENLVNDGKLKDASANNLAYCFQQIHSARRIEEGLSGSGPNVNVNIVNILNKGLKKPGKPEIIDAEVIDQDDEK